VHGHSPGLVGFLPVWGQAKSVCSRQAYLNIPNGRQGCQPGAQDIHGDGGRSGFFGIARGPAADFEGCAFLGDVAFDQAAR